jgi:hypothetical protein
MEVYGIMGNKVSACLYIDKGVLEAARQVGLNVSKVAENSARANRSPQEAATALSPIHACYAASSCSNHNTSNIQNAS